MRLRVIARPPLNQVLPYAFRTSSLEAARLRPVTAHGKHFSFRHSSVNAVPIIAAPSTAAPSTGVSSIRLAPSTAAPSIAMPSMSECQAQQCQALPCQHCNAKQALCASPGTRCYCCTGSPSSIISILYTRIANHKPSCLMYGVPGEAQSACLALQCWQGNAWHCQ